ncbi:dynein axonemal heavy chain 3-like [Neocloeon triangulifer]|uniref:dynein axonemal heavy chain 3-like n=1 Tax=Neocloeon triangulifer TaxID=2078957 RepID=UPI00286F698C|nr:dynein axonemal heavy chain 3-like [Neocloeon triangulifer]
MISELASAARAQMEKGARLSTLRYRLLDAEWRAQHDVPCYPWPWPLLMVRAPTPWHCSFLLGRQFCRHNLFTPHTVLRKLQALYEQRFEQALFVAQEQVRQEAPLTPQQLQARVQQLCANAKLLLLKEWLPACADVLNDQRDEWRHLAPLRRGETLRHVKRFFGCVAALMSRQLRSLTLRSNGNDFTPPFDDLGMLKPCLLMLHLSTAEGLVKTQPSREQVVEVAQSCLLSVLDTARQLPRLEQILLGDEDAGFLSAVDAQDEEAAALLQAALRAVEANMAGPETYLNIYAPYLNLLDGGAERALEEFREQGPTLKEWARYIERLQSLKVEVAALQRTAALNMVVLECGALNDLLWQRLEELRNKILDHHIAKSRAHNRRICNEFDEMSDRAAVLPEDTAGLVTLTQYLTHCQDVRMHELRKMIRTAAANLSFLVSYAIFPAEDVQLNARVFLWPRDMEAVFAISWQRLAHKREVVEATLRERKSTFEAGLVQHQQRLFELQRKDPPILTVDEMRDSVQAVNALVQALERDKGLAQAINEEEALLNWLPAPFAELYQMLEVVQPFQLLWTTVLDFHQSYDKWYYGAFKELDASQVEAKARNMHASLVSVAAALSKAPGSKRIAELTRSKLDHFINLLPLLHCVCTQGLCARHWEQMSAAVGETLDPAEVTTLSQVVQFGLMDHVALFQEVSECARREMALHERLLAMKDEWREIELPCVPYRDAGVATLGPLDHIQLMLDDHILRAQTMHSSPFVRAFEEEMQAWEDKLISMQDIIDAWLTCQALWLYLEPIFSSDDIMRQMPLEGAKFAQVDQSWRRIMQHTQSNLTVLVATDMPDMLPILRDCNKALEQIQKGLNEYLEKKRNFFPRFYFLSNDELLEVLSETKDPCKVKLEKCFDGAVGIELGAEGEIVNVESAEGEKLALSGRLVPSEAKGNVEKWLAQLEDVLVRSLRDTCREAVAAYQRQPRAQWALQWPGQAVSVAASIHWTTEAAAALRNNELKAFLEKSRSQIDDLLGLINLEQPMKTRRCLTNLLTSDLHNAESLGAFPEGVTVQDYAWASLVRHYWREDSVVVSLVGCDLGYGFEYLGCPERIVASPVIDSCLRAMVVALRGGFGVCLEASPSCGKTEICREAARMVARPFVVFACNETIALDQILKFGTVKAGAWLCLKNVERLSAPLVSGLTNDFRKLKIAAGKISAPNFSCALLDAAMFELVLAEVFEIIEKVAISTDVHFAEIVKIEAESRGLLASRNLINKSIQLKESIENWPAVILMGETLTGKTTCLQVSAAAVARACEGQRSVAMKAINPKALTLGRLLGQFGSTGEWHDGVLSTTFREFALSSSETENKWIILDGPLESFWSDNLNSALDETKKLCLTSGEMIRNSPYLKLVVECDDLASCSPSLISRCAVVHFEARQGSWHNLKEPFVKSDLRQRLCMDEQFELIAELIDWLLPPLITLTLSLESMLLPTDLILFNCFKKLYMGMLGEETQFSSLWLQNALIFSLIWGLGSCLTMTGRETFDVFFRSLLNGENKIYPRPKSFKLTPQQLVPEKGLVFDWALDKKNNATWLSWVETLPKTQTSLSQKIVAWQGVAVQKHFSMSNVSRGEPLLLVGTRGCGKTGAALDFLQSLPPEEYLVNATFLSGGSCAQQLQRTIVGRLDRRRKGVFGPPMGRRCLLYVDGLAAGHTGPAELLRQWLGHGHWYDHDNSKLELVDIVALLSTCNDAKSLPRRLLGQLLLIGLTDIPDYALEKIFATSLENHFSKGFTSNVTRAVKSIVQATVEFNKCAQKSLVEKSTLWHFLGLAEALSQALPSQFNDADKLSRLWIHELSRTYMDLLPSENQRQIMLDNIKGLCCKFMGKPMDSILRRLLNEGENAISLDHLDRLHFGNFMEPDANPKIYDEETALREKVIFYLREQVSCHGSRPVLTKYLLQHTTRVCRALQRPTSGHALLIGEPGSGRTFVAKIAAAIAGLAVFNISPSGEYGLDEWKCDLKKVLRRCGPEDKPTVLLLRENLLEPDYRLEDLSQIVAAAEIPTLWEPEERLELSEGMNHLAKVKGRKLEGTSAAVQNYFIERVRVNLHIVLVLEPKNLLVSKLHKFPILTDAFQSDYFGPWPAEALEDIATEFTSQIEVQVVCVAACREFHLASPPGPQAAFLRLMRTFVRLHAASSGSISTQKGRYLSGLQKLDQAATQVIEMRKQLQLLRPQLVETSEETDRLMIKIEQDTVEVEARKEIVGSDEAKANEAAAAAQAIKDDCESDLAEAVPALEAALTALDTLKPSDITVVKAMKNPPPGVKLVLEAISVMKGVKPDRKPHPSGSGKMIEDFWAPSLRLIGEIKFLDSLKSYEKDDIPPHIMARIREKYIHDREFRPEVVRKSSAACEGLCKWVRAIEVYDRVIKIVAPKKAKLAEAEAALAQQMATLNEKRTQLQQVSDKLQTLNDDFAAMSKKKKDLEDNIDLCSQKLERAEKLIGGLGGERTRWSELAASLEGRLDNVTGDVLLAAATVTYLGGLSKNQRESITKKWSAQLDVLGVAHSDPFNLATCLGDPVTIREWHMRGLSEEPFTVESALVATNCDAPPILIDPQGQGANWVRSTQQSVISANATHPEFNLDLEKALQEGSTIIVHLHEAKLPAILDSVVQRTSAGSVTLSEAQVRVHEDFRLYLVLSFRAQLTPDDLAKLTLVDFGVRVEGLEGRLLGLVVGMERPPLEAARHELAVEGAANKQQLQQIEHKILHVLSDTETNILEDETGLQVLTASKALSEEISSKQVESAKREIEIETARSEYLPVAKHATHLYFCLDSLANLHISYQFSLDWFTVIYQEALKEIRREESQALPARLAALKATLTLKIFEEVSPGLFECDRQILALLLWVAQLQANAELFPEDAWRAFLTGDNLNKVPGLENIENERELEKEKWQIFDSELEFSEIPEPYSNIKGLERLALIKSYKPHVLFTEIRKIIKEQMGESFLRPPTADLAETVASAGNKRCVIVALANDCDPVRAVQSAAKGREFRLVALGEGQEELAEEALFAAASDGHWLVLHNCHLASENWRNKLQRLTEKALASSHDEFRLVITFENSGVTLDLLRKGIKVASEAAGGLRSRILHCFNDPKILLEQKSKEEKTLLLALSLAHSVAQARGFAEGNAFCEQGLDLSYETLKSSFDEWGIIGFNQALKECILSARVSAPDARTALAAIADHYIAPEVLADEGISLARLKTTDLDSLEVDLAPETLHLSKSVQRTNGWRETQRAMSALQDLFKEFSSVKKYSAEESMILKKLSPLIVNKDCSAQTKEKLVLLQELCSFEKEAAKAQFTQSLKEKHVFLKSWLEGKVSNYWLGRVSRPKTLLRALAPPESRKLALCIAGGAAQPLFVNVEMEGAKLMNGELQDADQLPCFQLPPLALAPEEYKIDDFYHFECPLFESRDCRRLIGMVILPSKKHPSRWHLRGVTCYSR